MEHLFVNYKIARALKDKGFNEECFGIYLNGNNAKGWTAGNEEINTNEKIKNYYTYKNAHCSAPLYQQVIDWFETKHKLYIDAIPIFQEGNEKLFGWAYTVIPFADFKSKIDKRLDESFGRYGALQAAINEALKLI